MSIATRQHQAAAFSLAKAAFLTGSALAAWGSPSWSTLVKEYQHAFRQNAANYCKRNHTIKQQVGLVTVLRVPPVAETCFGQPFVEACMKIPSRDREPIFNAFDSPETTRYTCRLPLNHDRVRGFVQEVCC